MAVPESTTPSVSASAEARAQRQRRFWILSAAASYAIDTAFLALFAAAGLVDLALAALYGLSAALVCALVYAGVRSGFSLRFDDPGMIVAQMASGMLLTLLVVLAAPQIAFPWLLNLFTVFLFAMVWLPVRASIVAWLAGTAGTAAVLFHLGPRIGLPVGSALETGLTWLVFSTVLARCVVLSVYSTSLRERVRHSRLKLAQTLETVERLATHDELTQALNRRALLQALEHERARALRTGEPLSVALIDIDHFKAVNDRHGHSAGDDVLQRFARLALATKRDSDLFGRYGGEEFLLLMPATEPQAALLAVERLRAALRACDWSPVAAGLAVAFSAGVTELRDAESVRDLLARADLALYDAKHAGRNRSTLA